MICGVSFSRLTKDSRLMEEDMGETRKLKPQKEELWIENGPLAS